MTRGGSGCLCGIKKIIYFNYQLHKNFFFFKCWDQNNNLPKNMSKLYTYIQKENSSKKFIFKFPNRQIDWNYKMQWPFGID